MSDQNSTNFSSYEDIFGEIDFREGDEARSVLSPAAYLADLLQLYDDEFEEGTEGGLWKDRRTDIRNILLDEENSFTMVPYLDIVNEILEGRVNALPNASNYDGPYDRIRDEAKHPMNMPYNLDDDKVKNYLKHLDVSSEDLYKAFAMLDTVVSNELGNKILAREALGLSNEEYNHIVSNGCKITELYGLTQQDINNDPDLNNKTMDQLTTAEINTLLCKTDCFMAKTGISYVELKELIYQNLNGNESSLADTFFVNAHITGYAILDEKEGKIKGISDDSSFETWLKRAYLFISLAKKLELSFTDLDLILRTCCNNNLTDASIQVIAVVQKLSKMYELSVDIIGAFLVNMNVVGTGDEEVPVDLFNRIYNARLAPIDEQYVQGGSFLHEEYKEQGYTALEPVDRQDLLSEDNATFRQRICRALSITEEELETFIKTFNERRGQDKFAMSSTDQLTFLSLFFKVFKLTEILDLSVKELCQLLDVIKEDPSIAEYSEFDMLITIIPTEQDGYSILTSQSISNNLWLIQLLVSMTKWMQENDMTAQELKSVTSRAVVYTEEEEKELEEEEDEEWLGMKQEKEERINFFNNLYEQFKALFFNDKVFQRGDRDERTSKAIYRNLKALGQGIISAKDERILLCHDESDLDRVQKAAFRTFKQLDQFTPEDFVNIGLEDRMADKIMRNLAFKGYVDTQGNIIEDVMPEESDYFFVETNFDPIKRAVFKLMAKLYKKALSQEESSEDVQMSLFLTDLDGLNIIEAQQKELYDNLIFNHFIEEDGSVIDPTFFADKTNVSEFMLGTNLSIHKEDIFHVIMERMSQFMDKDIYVQASTFDMVSLSEKEVEELLENLRFNEYIDEDGRIGDKGEILKLSVEDFSLAIAFYPHRHAILEALKEEIKSYKANFYKVDSKMLEGVAGKIVAEHLYSVLKVKYLEEDMATKEARVFFEDKANIESFDLGDYFTNMEEKTVFNFMAKVLNYLDTYKLTSKTLEEMGLKDWEQELLIEMLEAYGHIENGKLCEGEVEYFLNVNNALDFRLERFDDYNKDIFFVLHDMAKEVNKQVDEISGDLMLLAATQQLALLSSLQDALGMSSDVIKAAVGRIHRGNENLVEQFLVPVLRSVDVNDKIMAEPASNKFNYLFRRLKQFGILANKLGFNKEQVDVVFADQDLAGKFPESLTLPDGITTFDVILEGVGEILYLFAGETYYAYSAEDYTLLRNAEETAKLIEVEDEEDELYQGLTEIDHFYYDYSEQGVKPFKIDAAFVDHEGTVHIITGTTYYYKEKEVDLWETKDRTWGAMENNFQTIDKVDGAFVDKMGKTYLFSKDQYIRYSGDLNANNGVPYMDEGYPKMIQEHFGKEFGEGELHPGIQGSLDASVVGLDDKTYLFKEAGYTCSDDFEKCHPIAKTFGHIANNFEMGKKMDAVFTWEGAYYFFVEDQVICYVNNIENRGLCVEEGYPMSIDHFIPDLPYTFKKGIEAAVNVGEVIHLISEGKTIKITKIAGVFTVLGDEVKTETRFGKIKNNIIDLERVHAAFVGLDGKAYLFSGDQYYRYSTADYSQVDPGYPRNISEDWGSLHYVDAAFVLDGKTYLCGMTENEAYEYVRYSTNDYTEVDEDYPKSIDDNWWNLPFALTGAQIPDMEESTLEAFDAIYNDPNGKTYLFAGSKCIYFDQRNRWWSEPVETKELWGDMPLNKVDAAFAGKEGKVYLFGEGQYVSYDANGHHRVNDGTPAMIKDYWGYVNNNIQRTGRIDSSLTVSVIEKDQLKSYAYVFAGDQYIRYTLPLNTDMHGDEGYPHKIATELAKETGFENLPEDFEGKIDAAFANQRNMYFFKGQTCHVVVESVTANLDKEYTLDSDADTSCVFVHDGNVYMHTESDHQWKRAGDLEEDGGLALTLAAPPLLRAIYPNGIMVDESNREISAILDGTDGNTYAFFTYQGEGPEDMTCYNFLMDREYSIKEEWGRVRNNIVENSKVDAAFVGVDGNTYMFSGDQYVIYDHEKVDGYSYIEEVPGNIADDFGGLYDVGIAFVREDVTYILEKPDMKGRFRYARYSGKDYTMPDIGYPKTADFDYWNIPDRYVEEGFNAVDAVYVEGDNTYLIKGDEMLSYNHEEDVWSTPKSVKRMWKDLPMDKIDTVFTGVDGATYFFCDGSYSCYQDEVFTEINIDPVVGENRRTDRLMEDIDLVWGKVDNKIVELNRVDAAFVDTRGITYLFCGDQYVRYSTSDYRFVDEGYPKKIYENLRFEQGFKDLDHSIGKVDEGMENQVVIKAVIANMGTIYVFAGDKYIALVDKEVRHMPVLALGHVRHELYRRGKVDAAFGDREKTYLLSGDQYIRYSDKNYDEVDEGYPKAIASLVNEGLGLDPATFTGNFTYDLDGALLKNGELYLFKGDDYYHKNAVKPVTDAWGKVKNVFEPELHVEDLVEIDGAFMDTEGRLYVFKDSQYIRYAHLDDEYVEEGYPKDIMNNWGDLPAVFEAGIDSAFNFEERTYMIKGDSYVRYSDPTFGQIDPIYPQLISRRFGEFADYLITDIKLMTDFKKMNQQYQGDDFTLTDFLHPEKPIIVEPYEAVASMFEWDVEELKWLKRKNGFLTEKGRYEEDFKVEQIMKLKRVFDLAIKMGTSPQELYEEVWNSLYSTPQSLVAAGKKMYALLGHNNSEQDFAILESQIHDEENIMKRDALVPYLIFREEDVNNSRDLYEKLLIDIEMDSCAKTSRIKEALACVQLYFHRYFMDLEQPVIDNLLDSDTKEMIEAKEEVVKERLKDYWQWMKNYRVWEANRKVFLYPENYIRPELRDTKTEQFKTMEEEILQGELTEELVEQAYFNYLDAYSEVSRLTVAGGYRYGEETGTGNDDKIILFGRTKVEPRKYFYRNATFIDGDTKSVEWDSWIDTELSIDSQKVYPVYAFGKTFVFWPQVEINNKERETQNPTAETKDGKKYGFKNLKVVKKVIKINYSYQNLNGKWVIPQTLDKEIIISETVSGSEQYAKSPVAVELSINTSQTGDEVSPENIEINCSYNLADKDMIYYNIFKWFSNVDLRVNKSFTLTPEMTTLDNGSSLSFVNKGQEVFESLFVNENINADEAVIFNVDEAPWFAFDHKGGSLLCKPSMFNIDNSQWPKVVDTTKLELGEETLDAAFYAGGKYYLFAGESYHVVEGELIDENGYFNAATSSEGNEKRWGKLNPMYSMSEVEAAFTFDNYTYIIRQEDFIRYNSDQYSVMPEGYPKLRSELRTQLNLDLTYDLTKSLDLTTLKIDSAFYFDNILYFISGTEVIPMNSEAPLNNLLSSTFTNHLKNATSIGTVCTASRDIMIYKYAESSTFSFYYCVFDDTSNNWVDHGCTISDEFGNVNIDASFCKNGQVYLIRGNELMLLNNIPSGNFNWRTDGYLVYEDTFDAKVIESATLIGQHLYLFGEQQYIRYTLDDKGVIPTYMDYGYPKDILEGEPTPDASFKLGSKYYLFDGITYRTVKETDGCIETNLNETKEYTNIAGSFVNLPTEFKGGFDAGVNDGTSLYLFKDNTYVKYIIGSKTEPYEVQDVEYDIIRLTSSTCQKLSTKLFTQGLEAFLSLDTQNFDELPKFSTSVKNDYTIRYRESRVNTVPVSDTLDYTSANSVFYWEMFYHIPFLLAQTFNTAQKFDEAKTWYEYVFDPSQKQWWKFLPFVIEPGSDDKAPSVEYLHGLEADEDQTQIRKYLEDPFDPHTIAGLRSIAYEKAIVMNYIDNIIDWGDMLFSQYTRESINEARMLYVLAYDLLGEKPESLGDRVLSDDMNYATLISEGQAGNNQDQYEFLLALENSSNLDQSTLLHLFSGGTINDSTVNPYFYIPENWFFINYWNTVEDRLYKIRHCMNIMGISQPLPLFQPPIDPMALVQAVAGGMSVGAAVQGVQAAVPHYRFSFMLDKAKELVSKVTQFGGDLLGTLEKKDAEALSILQEKQEAKILDMTKRVKQAQLDEAIEQRKGLEESYKNAENSRKHYDDLVNTGFSPAEIAQMGLMSTALALTTTAAIAKFQNMGISLIPKAIIGTFTYAEVKVDGLLENFAEGTESLSEGFNTLGEIVGLKANLERQKEDWRLQRQMAESEKIQLEHQIQAAKISESLAMYEIEQLEEEIRQNESIQTFMKDKFTNEQLYNWMAGKLSTLYFKTYKMAHEMAMGAQKAFQFERGLKESDVNYISSMYWDSLRKGLLAGETLDVDLLTMEKAYMDTNSRALEIAKPISLVEIDPIAFAKLKGQGSCDISLTEGLFDQDFQGHYGRQVKTISVIFDMGEGKAPVNATLTQLNHKTVMEADPKAVKYLFDPKDLQPTSIRSDWRSGQQIILSPRGEYEENNGLFELNYSDERYLPFEGTGAISRWRLELNGKNGSYNPQDLKDVILNLKYTAKQGGEAFGDTVRGMMKPHMTYHMINMEETFGDQWKNFLSGGDELKVNVTRDMLPNMTGSKVASIMMVADMTGEGKVSMTLDNGKAYRLDNGKFTDTTGLSISSRGSEWTLTMKGNKADVKNVAIVVNYKATV